MYLAEETSGGGDSVGELATPGQFHRRLGPESEILGGLSGPGRPTDAEPSRKGSGMSVPVDPRVEASDTAIDTTSRAIPSTAQRFSDPVDYDWARQNLIGWLDYWAARLRLPIVDSLPTRFSAPDATESDLDEFAVAEVSRHAAALLLDATGGDVAAAMQSLLDVHRAAGGAQA